MEQEAETLAKYLTEDQLEELLHSWQYSGDGSEIKTIELAITLL